MPPLNTTIPLYMPFRKTIAGVKSWVFRYMQKVNHYTSRFLADGRFGVDYLLLTKAVYRGMVTAVWQQKKPAVLGQAFDKVIRLWVRCYLSLQEKTDSPGDMMQSL